MTAKLLRGHVPICSAPVFPGHFSGHFFYGEKSLDREYMFQKFHQTRLSVAFTCGYMRLLGTLTFPGQGICDFVYILMMDLIGNLIKKRVKKGFKNAEEHERIRTVTSVFSSSSVNSSQFLKEAIFKSEESVHSKATVLGQTCTQVSQLDNREQIYKVGFKE